MKILTDIKSWRFDEQKFASLGKRKFGLIKQILVVLALAVPILLIIIFTSLICFNFPLLPGFLIPLSLLIFCILAFLSFKSTGEQQMRLWFTAKVFAVIPEIIWVSTFVFVLICWFGSVWFNFNAPNSKIMFPLAYPQEIAAGTEGNICCLSRLYNRLQIFDKSGRFLRGWFVGLPAGAFRIFVNESDHICVASENKRRKYYFDFNGNLIRISKIVSGTDLKFESKTRWETADSFGNKYKIVSPFLFPKVVKFSTSGEKSVFIKQPFGHWLITMPIPGFVFLMILVIVEGRLSRRLKTVRKHHTMG